MKTFYLILFVCFAVAIAIESRSILVNEHNEQVTTGQTNYDPCLNVSAKLMSDLLEINKTKEEWETPEMEENRFKIGCFISCVLQRFQILNGTVLNISKIVGSLELRKDFDAKTMQAKIDRAALLITDCGRQVENMTNVCLIGYKFYKCASPVAEMVKNARKN